MIIKKSADEIDKMRHAGRVVAKVFAEVQPLLRPLLSAGVLRCRP